MTTICWRNVREGNDFLRVSEDGRFVIKRLVIEKPSGLLRYSYSVEDLERNQRDAVGTLQAARRLAMKWAVTS